MKRSIFSLLCVMLVASACDKLFTDEETSQRYYANMFAYNVMRTYYLWNAERATEIDNWSSRADPVEKVKEVRYSADKWTTLYEDYSSFESAVTGTGKTLGLDITPYWANEEKTKVCGVVNFTYADSPARKAGLKRGDVIVKVDGEEPTAANYTSVLGKLYSADNVSVELKSGAKLDLTAVVMYENPVNVVKTFEQGGVKYGYLHFTSFTLDACTDLETAFEGFKDAGIQELILDLRYNGGGYTFTSQALGSMIAPVNVVKAQKVFNKEVYNSILAKELDEDTKFAASLTRSSGGTQVKIRTADVNPGVRHLWVLVTGSTASASEALICGLKPYMDVTLVGENTYGKFCGGSLITATDWFDAVQKQDKNSNIDFDEAREYVPTWGIYVITSRYADCNGVTLSMPSGIPADIVAQDNPGDGFQLGDPEETMLAAVLAKAAGSGASAHGATAVKAPLGQAVPAPIRRPGFGVLLH